MKKETTDCVSMQPTSPAMLREAKRGKRNIVDSIQKLTYMRTVCHGGISAVFLFEIFLISTPLEYVQRFRWIRDRVIKDWYFSLRTVSSCKDKALLFASTSSRIEYNGDFDVGNCSQHNLQGNSSKTTRSKIHKPVTYWTLLEGHAWRRFARNDYDGMPEFLRLQVSLCRCVLHGNSWTRQWQFMIRRAHLACMHVLHINVFELINDWGNRRGKETCACLRVFGFAFCLYDLPSQSKRKFIEKWVFHRKTNLYAQVLVCFEILAHWPSLPNCWL